MQDCIRLELIRAPYHMTAGVFSRKGLQTMHTAFRKQSWAHLPAAALVFFAWAGGVRAEGYKILLMVDSSSSMLKTDPQNLRKVASELFIDLAAPGDRISVWQFDAEALDLSGGFQTVQDTASRERLKKNVAAIGSSGVWTDFGSAFRAASEALQSGAVEGEKPLLVFMTDGRCDPGPDARIYKRPNERLNDFLAIRPLEREIRCRQYVLAWLGKSLRGVPVVAVGLSRGAPKDFLAMLAERSNGQYLVTEKAEELPLLFAQVHAFSSGAQLVTPQGTALTVDPLVTTLQVVAVAKGGAGVELVSPDWNVLPAEGPGVSTARTEQYTVIQVAKPAAGVWTLKSPRPLPASAIVAVEHFNFQLAMESPDAVVAGKPIEVKVLLTAGGGAAGPGAEFMNRHRFVLTASRADGDAQELELTPTHDGRRAVAIPTQEPGRVGLVARMEPGRTGSVAKRTPLRMVDVVPALAVKVDAPLQLGELRPDMASEATVDLSSLETGGYDIEMGVSANGLPVQVSPQVITVNKDHTIFKIAMTLWPDAEAGAVSGVLALEPRSDPYRTSEALRIPVVGTAVVPGFFRKYIFVIGAAALVIIVAAFLLRARAQRSAGS